MPGQDAPQRRVEPAGGVVCGGGRELVLEAKPVQKRRSRALLWAPKLSCVPKGSGTRGERLAEVFAQHGGVRHVVGNLAQPVHVVAEGEQAGRLAR